MQDNIQVLTATGDSVEEVPVKTDEEAVSTSQQPDGSESEDRIGQTAPEQSGIDPGHPETQAPGAQDGQSIRQEVLLPAPASDPAAGSVTPFIIGVLAALVLCLLAALIRRLSRRRPATGRITAGHVQEVGARDSQQDAFGISGQDMGAQGALAVVADGMGGLVNSGQVSQELVSAMMDAWAPGDPTPPERQLQLLFQQALRRVDALLKDGTAQSGSTLVACLLQNGGLSWLSVGDSRIYLWRGGGLIQLNRDHEFHHDLTLLALQEEMTLAQADGDSRRENLTSYIGGGFPRKVEWNPEPVMLLKGDKVLLVSDGVYRALSQAEIASCLSKRGKKSEALLCHAILQKQFPQQDNFTAIILNVV